MEMSVFFFNDTATTEIYTLSLHDALPISREAELRVVSERAYWYVEVGHDVRLEDLERSATHFDAVTYPTVHRDRKSTRLNSSHANISYAVFCLKKNTLQILLHFTISLLTH